VHTISLRSAARTQLIDITGEVQAAVTALGVKEGVCTVFAPHTTAGVTINENADPSVRRDILHEIDKIVPFEDGYTHGEGNSAAHIKASLVGSSVQVLLEDGRLALGTWQGIFFAEFDGPRHRKVYVTAQ